jgi:hypothetical protein
MRAAIVLLLLLVATVAHAESSQRELLRQAQGAELRFDPTAAVALYRDALERDPSSRLARRIRARLSWFDGRREGDFAPLAELMRVRRERSPSADTIDAFSDKLERFPAGRVRRESLALAADAYLARLDQPQRSLTMYRAWLASDGLSEAERQLAVTGVALSQARMGDPEASLASLRRAQLSRRPEAKLLRGMLISRIGRRVAYSVLLLFLVLGLVWGGWRGTRSTVLLPALGSARIWTAAYVLLLPLLMVWLYDWRLLPQFAWLVVSCALTLLLASVLGAGVRQTTRTRWRIYGFAALSAAATLAAAFVALDHSRLLLDLMLASRARP